MLIEHLFIYSVSFSMVSVQILPIFLLSPLFFLKFHIYAPLSGPTVIYLPGLLLVETGVVSYVLVLKTMLP